MIKAGELYLFLKSGNWVRTIEQDRDGLWTVERVNTGKQMLVNASALVACPEEHGIEVCAAQDPRPKKGA
jgi:hypothetical protein